MKTIKITEETHKQLSLRKVREGYSSFDTMFRRMVGYTAEVRMK